MYEEFFGLQERPFDLTPNPRFLVLTDSHREALSNLEYAISSRKGVTLLIGEAGSGKTTIIRTAIGRQPARVHTVHLNNPTMTRSEFGEMLAARFSLSDHARRSKTALLIELEALLRHRRLHGEMSLLIVDEAQSLPLELLEEIRLLANIESEDDKLLSVILAGQPELAFRLNNQELRQLKQRVALRCELRALTFTETMTYLDGRIRAAGGGGVIDVFTRQAVELIHSRSHGIPRTVNVISDNALLGGFAAGEKPISAQTIREVCRDFDLTDIPDGLASLPEPAGMATPPWSPSPVALPLRAPEPRTAAVGAAAEPERDRRAAQGIFGEFASKRKRFSFFRN